MVGLYSLRLSPLLLYGTEKLLFFLLVSLTPFVLVSGVVLLGIMTIRYAVRKDRTLVNILQSTLLSKRVRFLFFVWAIATTLEIYVAGGIPIVWLLTGSSSTYVDFGVPSVHGFLNSMITAISLVSFFLFLDTGKKSYLLVPALTMLWSVLVLTRQLLMVNIMQFLVLLVLVRGLNYKYVIQFAVVAMALISIFGAIGDIRTGAEKFIALTEIWDYPDWLPTGFLWFYMYMVTPLNNLLYTMNIHPNVSALSLINTLASLFPTAIRVDLVGETNASALVADAFNVSSAFAGPYLDMGVPGIVVYSTVLAAISSYFWHQNGVRSLLIYAVLAQCVLVSVFYNALFALPVIFQAFWLYYIFSPRVRL